MAKFEEYDVFGNPIETDAILRDDFIEPPFSVLDGKEEKDLDLIATIAARRGLRI